MGILMQSQQNHNYWIVIVVKPIYMIHRTHFFYYKQK